VSLCPLTRIELFSTNPASRLQPSKLRVLDNDALADAADAESLPLFPFQGIDVFLRDRYVIGIRAGLGKLADFFASAAMRSLCAFCHNTT